MARLDGNMTNFAIGKGGFAFTGARFDKLGATDYTLATIATDISGSTSGFENELQKMEVMAVDACRKSPRSENILIRLLRISSVFPGGVEEVHGFKPLAEIDTASYPLIKSRGGTPLCDGCYSSIGATNTYGEQLRKQDFGVNGIVFVITDGEENMSTATMQMVKEEQQKAITGEQLESLLSILIGINTMHCGAALQRFQTDAGMSQYVDVGNATPRNLAKLAVFVSQSVSSQSQALGTGGPSKQISATI